MRTREEQYNDPRFVKELQFERHKATGVPIVVYLEEKPTGLPETSSQTIEVYSGHWSTPNWNNPVKRYVSVDAMEQAILEAERRAEQRVRAEIGMDSERLDWLESTVKARGKVSFSFDPKDKKNFPYLSVRVAIDAARELG